MRIYIRNWHNNKALFVIGLFVFIYLFIYCRFIRHNKILFS